MASTSQTPFPGVALVTGAAGTGIGSATAKAFAAAGCTRIALTDISMAFLEPVKSGIEQSHPQTQICAIAGDISDAAFVRDLADQVVARFGRLDYAVNCAGVSVRKVRCDEMEVDEFDRVNAVNYRGVWLSSRAEISAMLQQGPLKPQIPGRSPQRGAIVNIASQLGIVGKAKQGPYCASKAAVISLTRTDAIDYARDGIRVNCICPGVIETPMTVWDDASREAVEPYVQMAPVGRIGRPEEIADAALFLCSERASFVVGHAMVVDGGYILT